jgi:hypothetical protein
MNGLRDAAAEPAPGAGSAQVPLASWYTQGTSDGFGDRLLMSDNTSATSLELLRFRPELAIAPGFERTLRETVSKVASFDHPAFAPVRAVEYLDSDSGLVLVSTHVPGRRLSELFQGAERTSGVHPAFVAWMIRWLTPAIAHFTAETRCAHGTISPDRVVLAPDGRPVLVEHVVGRAIDQLGLSADRLWQHFQIVAPPGPYGTPRLNDRTDVFQLGALALSLLLGRRLTPVELRENLQGLLDEFARSAEGRASSFTAPLLLWLDRALRTDEGAFRSAREARDGVRQLSHAPRPDRFPLIGTRTDDPRLRADIAAAGRRRDVGRSLTARNVAYALGAVVLIQATAIALLLRSGDAAPTPVAVRIESPQPGDIVTVDEVEIGVTPLALNLDQSIGTIRIRPAAPRADTPAPAAPRAAARLPSPRAAPEPVRQAPPQPTGFRLASPIELQVFVGDRLLGSSADGAITTSEGIHQLEFVNEALGYRSQQTVQIRQGEIRTVTIQPPGGRVSINAMPWAQVWIDGEPVGETPIAYLPLPAGEHEIVFRHPELGERRETLLVKSGGEMRISATFVD